jgi:uncharacterized protein YdaU (DUF1376 family)
VKWYYHDPAAFLEGCIGLNAEERGFYITLLDLIYARAPNGSVTDELVVKAMACRPQVWRRVKASLIAKGKVREAEGWLMANRVETTLQTAAKLMANRTRSGRVSALKRAEINALAEKAH